MQRVGGDDLGQETTSMGKVAFTSFIGTAIEFYDFYIYGTAALVFGGVFFPEFAAATGTLASFATFAVAFFARPLGAVIFGPMDAYLPELFGTRLQYSGAAVSYNLGGVIGGGLGLTIASQLLVLTDVSWSISLYMLLMSVVGFVSIFFLSETHLSDISAMRSEEERLLSAEGIAAQQA